MTTIITYILFGCFFIIEARLRKGPEANSRDAGENDRRSTRWVGLAFGLTLICLIAAPLLNVTHVGQILRHSILVGWAGVLIIILGLLLRVWSARVLGAFYTRTLRTIGQQQIVQNGPYRSIRHPGYLGRILMGLGAGLAVLNWIVLSVILVVTIASYAYRIQAEEVMLAQAFGKEFVEYKARTWKLIPLIY